MMWQHQFKTRYVDGSSTSEVTPVTIQYIQPVHHGHIKVTLTFLVFYVNRPSHSWNEFISNFDIESSRSWSCVCSKGHGHMVGQISNWFASFSFHINQINNSWKQLFWYLNLKSKVKVIDEIKSQGQMIHPVYNRCTSCLFHFNRTNHSWDWPIECLTLKKKHIRFKN